MIQPTFSDFFFFFLYERLSYNFSKREIVAREEKEFH